MIERDLPLITFALISFNQEEFIREAVLAAFAQDYSPLEIIISDDCSMDGTYQIARELASEYSGPHKITLIRNTENIGLIGQINKVTEMAAGELIVVAAGDDVSFPHRVQRLAKAWMENGMAACSVHSSVLRERFAGDEGKVFIPPAATRKHSVEDIATSTALIIGASHAWSKELFREFGPIRHGNSYEDLIVGFRAILRGGIVYVDEPLLRYRAHSGVTAKERFDAGGCRGRISKQCKAYIPTFDQKAEDANFACQYQLEASIREVRREFAFRLDFLNSNSAGLSGLALLMKGRDVRFLVNLGVKLLKCLLGRIYKWLAVKPLRER